MWIPLIVYTAVPVLFGALLSIPAQYIARFFKRFKIVGYGVFVAVVALLVWGIVSLISIMPENINISSFYQSTVQPTIHSFLSNFRSDFSLIDDAVSIFIGQVTSSGKCAYSLFTFLLFLGMVGVTAALFGIVFVTTRFFFYNVMRKSFEYDKFRIDEAKKNKVHSVWATFLVKEMRLSLRSSTTVLNFVSVYIVVPILVFLMNKVFSAIDTSIRGDNFAYAFNLLTITLPMLASNALIAKAYSKEGRAAYIKKTKPLNVVWPLTAKMFLNIVASFVSILISVSVFSYFNGFSVGQVALLFVGVFLFHLGHMVISATLDVMNPLNEQYATDGDVSSNKNENLSTIFAFLMSVLFAAASYFLFKESAVYTNDLWQAFIKLFLIGTVVFACAAYMFVSKVKAYYYER